MTDDHRYCDELFARAERALSEGAADASEAWKLFEEAVLTHFGQEEEKLFAPLEAQMGEGGPPAVMRQEHAMMRDMMKDVRARIEAGERDSALDAADGLMAMIQQHNMKEEHVLYPMLDRMGADAGSLAVVSQSKEA
ncbi:MAG: hemerythrin domain-containing protein [Gammaproteobacteria bacterium]|nr:MAG: hemerythrin domain-containing protein [Gammaproteobacteria bacterium]